MTARIPSAAGLLAGACVIAVGLFAAWEATSYSFGALNRPGPGLFPLALGLIMVGLGVGIVAESLVVRRAADALERPNIRSVLAILAAFGAFALLVERAGLVPAIVAAVLVSALAEPRTRIVQAAALAAGLAAVCVLIFVEALNLPLRPFAW